MQEEVNKKQKKKENINKQRHRDKHVLNKDLIDFAHPENNNLKGHSADQRNQYAKYQQPEDEEAQQIMDKRAR